MPGASPGTLTLLAKKANGDKSWRTDIREAVIKAGSLNGAAKLLNASATMIKRLVEEDPTIIKGLELGSPGNPNWIKKVPAPKKKKGRGLHSV
jgi:hypothetical protein